MKERQATSSDANSCLDKNLRQNIGLVCDEGFCYNGGSFN